MNAHCFAEIAQQLLRTAAAGVFLIRIARLAMDQLLILKSHAAAAGPVFVLVCVDVIEFYQSSSHNSNAPVAESCSHLDALLQSILTLIGRFL